MIFHQPIAKNVLMDVLNVMEKTVALFVVQLLSTLTENVLINVELAMLLLEMSVNLVHSAVILVTLKLKKPA
jgi:hypothetical protein